MSLPSPPGVSGLPRSSAARARSLGRVIVLGLIVAVSFYYLFFSGLTAVGLLGPDEPRYASIGREMARSGDWITPRLWGEPWFEKPALLYWMIGGAFRAGLSDDLAPRLPVAILGAGFLAFYYLVLRREFGASAAFFATAILGTSAAWIAFSRVGVTDLPMSAAFSAAMLLCLPRVRGCEKNTLRDTAAAALLGVAVLAKGLVPLVLSLPLAWYWWRSHAPGRVPARHAKACATIAAFVLVAAPWYVLCTLANGTRFLDDFFLRHHFGRFASETLQHEQPFWFYIPVLLAALFPWTPLMTLLFRKNLYRDPRARFLLISVGFGFVFFSAAINKLPGYLLPLIPALAALLGIALAEAKKAEWAMAACAVLFALVPAIAGLLPEALLRGISRATVEVALWPAAPALLLASVVWWLERKGCRAWSAGCIAGAMVIGTAWMGVETLPVLDRAVSTRQSWRQIAGIANEVCLEQVNRGVVYNLNYYSVRPLPECSVSPRRFHITGQRDGTGRGLTAAVPGPK